MKNKRKEILRDLLGEFGSEDGNEEDSERSEEKTYEKSVKESKYVPEKLEREEEDSPIDSYISREIEREEGDKSTESYLPRKVERKEEKSLFFDDDEDGYQLDSIMENEPTLEKVIDKPKRRPKKIKKMTEGIKAEIIEERPDSILQCKCS